MKVFVDKEISDRLSVFLAIAMCSLVLLLAGCTSSLHRAKLHLAEAQLKESSWQTEQAVALYKKTLEEAEREVRKKPSAQVYMIKGLAEVKLDRWSEATRSFRLAASLGEEKAESWAREVSIYGLAISLQEQGLSEPAGRLLTNLSERGKFVPVVRAALGRLVDYRLETLGEAPEKEREKIITKTIETVGKALDSDPACGYYHYLLSQLLSYQKKYLESFQEAVMARELGLPGQAIHRDNDNQIVFCYQQLKRSLSGESWDDFLRTYRQWTKKWNWVDDQTPDWKRR